MEHLNDQDLRAALAGNREVARRLAAHLAQPCEACEAYLQSATDLLEGEIDALLLSAREPPQAPLDELGFARVMRALRVRRTGDAAAAALGMAASLLLVAGLTWQPSTAEVKGVPTISVELSAVARSEDGVLRRVDPGSVMSDGDVLLLRYHATESAKALLLEQVPDGNPAPLGAFELLPGTHDLERSGTLAGVSLAGLSGPVTFWLLASSTDTPDLVKARKAVGAPGDYSGGIRARFPVVVKARHHLAPP
jgi:hypothetical protein